MKLRYTTTSPYVRKVTALALETGLDSRIERVSTNPWDPETDLSDQNPLGKVPALLLDDGQVFVDSNFICEYLDSLHDGPRLFPEEGAARWQALRRLQFANGILEASVLCFVETGRRPEALRWPAWIERQSGKVNRTLDLLESEAAALEGPLDIGKLALAIALDYVDFRVPELAWREGRDALESWHREISKRPSLASTKPRDP